MELTLAKIAEICQGKLSPDSNGQQTVNSVAIDSRRLEVNTMFVALKGDNHDGHDFVDNCLKSGAVAALVNLESAINIPNVIQVADTVEALGKLAHYWRMQFTIPVVAITGSNGKTTVKELLKSICCAEFGVEHVLATTGNLNNHLGLPLTLCRLTKQHKVAVLEMGMNHAGELTYLSKIASPTVAVVNNAMLAHAGFFNDVRDIALAKGEIFSGLIPNGIACINQASTFANLWANQLSRLPHTFTFVPYAVDGSSCYIKSAQEDGTLVLCTTLGDIKCKLQLLGSHNQSNAMTAATLALNIGCSLSSIKTGLENYTGYAGRLQRKHAFNGALIVDDSYNGNPDSVKAAILAIKHLPKPHWFVLGDLGELGKFAETSHHELGTFAYSNGIDKLITVGELTKLSYDSYMGDKVHFLNNQDVVEYCLQHLPKESTLLIKGSHSMNLADVVNKLSCA